MHTFAQKQKDTQQKTSAKSTKLDRALSGQSSEIRSILHLQRTIGNHTGQRLLHGSQSPSRLINGSTISLRDLDQERSSG